MASHRFVTLEVAAAMIAPGSRVLLGAAASLPQALLDTVRARPELWQGVCLTGAFIPGINDQDLTAVGSGTRVETIFATAGLASGAAAGRVAHLPLHYGAFWQRLSRPGVVDVVVLTVPPPRRDRTVGLGVTADFAPAAIAAGAVAIGVVNPAMPDVAHGPRWPVERFAALTEGPAPLACYDPGPPDAASRAIAAHLLDLMRPGDTLQLGLGKLQGALLEALAEAGLPDLGYHAGMISGPMLPLLHAGLFPRGVTTGVAIGPEGFSAAVAGLPGLRFAPVGDTHALDTLAKLPGLFAVNGCLEVDLAGQANAETLGGRQISGQGGLVDFLRGARASPGGRGVLALPATARGGTRSRIVPTLEPGAAVSVARADVDYVVTEFGVAELREASLAERAERLVAIAAPAHRDNLWADWEDRKRHGGGARAWATG
jgi:acyl-CoA hydrolase